MLLRWRFTPYMARRGPMCALQHTKSRILQKNGIPSGIPSKKLVYQLQGVASFSQASICILGLLSATAQPSRGKFGGGTRCAPPRTISPVAEQPENQSRAQHDHRRHNREVLTEGELRLKGHGRQAQPEKH